MFPTFWATGSSSYLGARSEIRKEDIKVSTNYRAYAAKMAEVRAHRASNRPLHNQINELFAFVMRCEARWK